MRIDGIGSQINPAPIVEKQTAPVEDGAFGGKLRDAVQKVSDLESQANDFATKLAAGDAVEIHQAMLAMQKASTALQFTIQVRNKIIEAYHEIMRMQV